MAIKNQLGNSRHDRFALRREPNGVYRVDGRVIPVCDDRAESVGGNDDGESVVCVHDAQDMRISRFGSVLGMNVEERVLELPVRS